ncbi:c-type cytochrome [Maribacter polysiphoniae]|uniref:C-type cytochrome n=1 Tax=Maribacter polysiphoniae TaxID=429344 RepID=A0A316DQR9_9FLAO|nr:c-type cytochrome [Maribacter polysiphoniae]MBD1262841.1 c-type cytochrome [Maribacter polysiphoniae]PWK20156.1 cytochrome c [Maribacter polysiphoniae]
MRLVLLFIGFLFLSGCKEEKKSNEGAKKSIPERAALSRDSQIFLGNRLFSEKTCITCHDINKKKIGPSIKEIMKVYKSKNGDIFAFLKGNAQPIVDTTASQVAIMQANINGFLKGISDEELKTISTYMLHVDELNPDQ